VHLAEIIALLGRPPNALPELGKSSHKFFTDTGDSRADIPIPDSISLRERDHLGRGERESREFLAMMRKMPQWEQPSKRSSAKALADDEWIMQHI